MRLFTAIDLPEEMLEKLRDFVGRLRPLARLHWSPIENLHITTKFIGEWPEARMEEMAGALRRVCVAGPITISVRGLGWFPNVRNPHTFWAGVDADESLRALAGFTEQAVVALGVPAETRAFSPHLTLARLKKKVPLDEVIREAGDADFGAFQAFSFFLYLSANGTYSKLAEFPLNS